MSGLAEFMGQRCYDELIIHQNFEDTACLKLLLSKLLSCGVLVGSLVYKLPQILKIASNKSAQGVTITSVLLELMAVTFALSYSFNMHFPFMTYGEVAFIAFFDILIIFQILKYEHGGVGISAFAGLGAYVALIYVFLLSGWLPLPFFQILQSLTTPLTIASRIPQIWQNYRSGSTGQLSFITWFLNLGGTLSRVFTTIQEVNDPLVLGGFLVAAILNGTIVLQILYYWNVKPKKGKAQKKKAPTNAPKKPKSAQTTPKQHKKKTN
jgi:mannose-P-dolichol utilization defect protein 1